MFKHVVANLDFQVTGLEVLNFFGFGNETSYDETLLENNYYDIDQQQFVLSPYIDVPFAFSTKLSLGTTLKYVQTEKKQNNIITALNPYGMEDIVLNSFFISFISDTRNGIVAPTEGYYFNIKASVFPVYLKNEYLFGKLRALLKYYYDFSSDGSLSIAFRAGAEKIWGTFPFFEAAFLGGQETLRGHEKDRFAGDASFYTGAEIRSYIMDFFLVAPLRLGVNFFAETGRIFSERGSSILWHNTIGAGILTSILNRDLTFNLSVARSKEDTQFYLITGFAF